MPVTFLSRFMRTSKHKKTDDTLIVREPDNRLVMLSFAVSWCLVVWFLGISRDPRTWLFVAAAILWFVEYGVNRRTLRINCRTWTASVSSTHFGFVTGQKFFDLAAVKDAFTQKVPQPSQSNLQKDTGRFEPILVSNDGTLVRLLPDAILDQRTAEAITSVFEEKPGLAVPQKADETTTSPANNKTLAKQAQLDSTSQIFTGLKVLAYLLAAVFVFQGLEGVQRKAWKAQHTYTSQVTHAEETCKYIWRTGKKESREIFAPCTSPPAQDETLRSDQPSVQKWATVFLQFNDKDGSQQTGTIHMQPMIAHAVASRGTLQVLYVPNASPAIRLPTADEIIDNHISRGIFGGGLLAILILFNLGGMMSRRRSSLSPLTNPHT